jgi:hypothetical protein
MTDQEHKKIPKWRREFQRAAGTLATFAATIGPAGAIPTECRIDPNNTVTTTNKDGTPLHKAQLEKAGWLDRRNGIKLIGEAPDGTEIKIHSDYKTYPNDSGTGTISGWEETCTVGDRSNPLPVRRTETPTPNSP